MNMIVCALRSLALLRFLGLLLLWLCCQCAVAADTPVIALDADTRALTLSEPLALLTETGPSAGIVAIIKGARGVFNLHEVAEPMTLDRDRSVWVHLKVQRSADASPDWVLNIPLPYIDAVEFYLVDAYGNILSQKAGDTIAVGRWTNPSLYPDFRFTLRDTHQASIYLKINNYRPLHTPIRLSTSGERDQQRILELVFIGAMLGSLFMLICWCILRYWESHEAAEGWYVLYTLLMLLVGAQAVGLANLWFWPYAAGWADYASIVLPLLGVGASTLLLRHLANTHVRYPLLDTVLTWFSAGCGALIMLEWVITRQTAASFDGVYFLAGPLLAILTTLRLWRDGSPLGSWLFVAYAPQGLAVLYISGQMLNLFPVAWQARYYMVLSVTLSVPLLLHALTLRSRQRLSVTGRARAADTQDALTGLLVRDRFLTHVQHAIYRAAHERAPAALAVIEIANYQHIQQQLGFTVAEQCLLRGVVKLHRVLRDVDPAGRIDIARFGVILEGAASREAVNERMVGLIASGLIPLPGMHPEVTLHFHVAAVVLDEVHPDPRTVLDELGEILGGIAPRSRRPIRFMDPATTLPAPPEPDSGFGSQPDLADETPPASPRRAPSTRTPQAMPRPNSLAAMPDYEDTVATPFNSRH
jgi:GGDEF domain-containing protein